VKFLAIENSEDLRSPGFDDKSSPLHLALREGHLEVACVLVEHGADVTVQDNDGSTSLHGASRWGDVDLAWLLVKHGADTLARDKHASCVVPWAS
jgi:ankyrin repeat protein